MEKLSHQDPKAKIKVYEVWFDMSYSSANPHIKDKLICRWHVTGGY
jgi:hypothetical protein